MKRCQARPGESYLHNTNTSFSPPQSSYDHHTDTQPNKHNPQNSGTQVLNKVGKVFEYSYSVPRKIVRLELKASTNKSNVKCSAWWACYR